MFTAFVQAFERRSHAVTEREQANYWCHLSQQYMTEESDDPSDENVIIMHKLPWRSESELLPIMPAIL